MSDSAKPICVVCGGSGMRPVQREDGVRAVRDCECRVAERQARMLGKAKIPRLYETSSLQNFSMATDGADNSLYSARCKAREFVSAYPLQTRGTGLLFVGPPGIGKTHLAIGVMRGLMEERGADCLFCHYPDLLKQVQNSYNRSVATTELDILDPIYKVDVLVLDELGASKPSDWVFDTIAHIINTRYNERRTTIITTNYANEGPLLNAGSVVDTFAQARAAMRAETLGDRIGERMRSRLQEMCVLVEMQGVDYRQAVKTARFG